MTMHPASPALRQLNVLGVHHSQMPRKSIVSAKRFLFGAQRAVHLLLTRVVDGVLMPGEVVRPREDCIARLARGRIYPFALLGLLVSS